MTGLKEEIDSFTLKDGEFITPFQKWKDHKKDQRSIRK